MGRCEIFKKEKEGGVGVRRRRQRPGCGGVGGAEATTEGGGRQCNFWGEGEVTICDVCLLIYFHELYLQILLPHYPSNHDATIKARQTIDEIV